MEEPKLKKRAPKIIAAIPARPMAKPESESDDLNSRILYAPPSPGVNVATPNRDRKMSPKSYIVKANPDASIPSSPADSKKSEKKGVPNQTFLRIQQMNKQQSRSQKPSSNVKPTTSSSLPPQSTLSTSDRLQ